MIARHSEHLGWFVSVANIRECDEFGGDCGGCVVDMDAVPEKLTLPFWNGVDCTTDSLHHCQQPRHLK